MARLTNNTNKPVSTLKELNNFIEWLGNPKLEEVRRDVYIKYFGKQSAAAKWPSRKAEFINDMVGEFVLGQIKAISKQLPEVFDGVSVFRLGEENDALSIRSSNLLSSLSRLHSVVQEEVFTGALEGKNALKKSEAKILGDILTDRGLFFGELNGFLLKAETRESSKPIVDFLSRPEGLKIITGAKRTVVTNEQIYSPAESPRFHLLFEYLKNEVEPRKRAELVARLTVYIDSGWAAHDLSFKTTHSGSKSAKSLSLALDALSRQYDESLNADGFDTISARKKALSGLQPLIDERFSELLESWSINKQTDHSLVSGSPGLRSSDLQKSGVIDVVMLAPDANGKKNKKEAFVCLVTSLDIPRGDRQQKRHLACAKEKLNQINRQTEGIKLHATSMFASRVYANDVESGRFRPVMEHLSVKSLGPSKAESVNMITSLIEMIGAAESIEELGKISNAKIITFGAKNEKWANLQIGLNREDGVTDAEAGVQVLKYAISCFADNVKLLSPPFWSTKEKVNWFSLSKNMLEQYVEDTAKLGELIDHKMVRFNEELSSQKSVGTKTIFKGMLNEFVELRKGLRQAEKTNFDNKEAGHIMTEELREIWSNLTTEKLLASKAKRGAK